ncbi:hypothetical protein EDD16DRAFT_228200 [Pisolithus croceorrhizus]|nr:hypothetical protein EV401DRAFT_737832 [Pisolithus croceorrhizus]KAI6105126.1 hypothetical protein EDD16DRAFT_228200 [Pisolithus croceorrhizus]KAI6165495.1 hypothetical protein EDD17DRAFT_232570 [Pisolithus thermaeus]
MARFQWENPEQFIGLVNLLSLRNGGQLQPDNSDEAEHRNIDACRDDLAVWEGKEDELKQQLLDRFAEILSRDKGGKYVCCVALHQSAGRHLTESVGISLLVARNHDFQKEDRIFCETLERLLAAIGAFVQGKTNSISAVMSELWEELMCYNQPRLDKDADLLRRHLRAFKASGSLDSIPPHNALKLPQDNISECRIFCDDHRIGPYSEATHEAYMRLIQERIRRLDDILCTGDSAVQRRFLVEYSYSILQMESLRIYLYSFPQVSAAHRFLSDIRSLGRLKSSYYMLVKAALNIPGFAQLSITLVKNFPPRLCPSTLPSLADVMKSLDQTFNPTFVHQFINRTLGVIPARWSFEQRQKSVSQGVLHIHAELQLILHITKMPNVEVMKEIYPYIGCSKLSCFLCAAFLGSFRYRGIMFGTRGCHGRIYTRWSVPDMNGLHNDAITALHSALKTMWISLVHEMLTPLVSNGHIRKLSAGVTVYDSQLSLTHKHHKYPVALCEVDSLSDDVSESSASSDSIGGLAIPCEQYGECSPETLPQSSQSHIPRLRSEIYDNQDDYRRTSSSVMGCPFDAAHYPVPAHSQDFVDKHEVMAGDSRDECPSWIPNLRYEHPEFLAVARPYLDPEDRKKELCRLVPEAKRKSFILYAMLLNGYHPYPSIQSDTTCKDLYFEFGFVAGRGSQGEQVLPWVYRNLISKCSFREFWTAFQHSNLVALMDAKGLGPMHKEVQHFEGFMKTWRNHWCPTVWHLKLLVNSPDVDPPRHVTADYGFYNCKTVIERISLKEVYKELLNSPMVDPMELHAACIKGKLYDFIRGHKPNLEQRFKRLMTNIHPLRNGTEGVNAPPNFPWFLFTFFFISSPFMPLPG